VTQSAIAYLDRLEMVEIAVNADPITRFALASEEWKDKEAVARYLNPARYQLTLEQAQSEIDLSSAALFVRLQNAGKLPYWIIQRVEYERIMMVAENG
jgi:hypothetical protein